MDFQVNLRNVLEVNEVSQICTLETTIRMFWTDWRVKLKQSGLQSELSYVTLNPSAADMFWIPGHTKHKLTSHLWFVPTASEQFKKQ